MKKHTVTLLTGLTVASMSISAPVSVFAAEADTMESTVVVPVVENGSENSSEQSTSSSTTTTSEPSVQTEQTTNEDGSVTTTTTSTVTETTIEEKEPVVETTPVVEGDTDYVPITDENGDTLVPYEKTTTTPCQEVTTETVTTVTSTTEKTQMTNQVDTADTEVSEVPEVGDAEAASSEVSAKTDALLNAQNITSDFDVYANTMDESIGHVDGNVAVKNMETGSDVTIMNKEQYGSNENNLDYAKDGYSYVGNANGSRINTNSNQTVKDPETGENKNASLLVVGENVEVTDNNSGHANMFAKEEASLDENGNLTQESAEALAKKDPRLQNIAQVADIDNNLDKIANAGQELIDATKDEDDGSYSVDTDIHKFDNAIRIISDASAAVKNKINVLNISIKKAFLTDTNQTGKINDINNALRDIVQWNETGTKVIVNVDTADDSDIEVTGMMANIGAYTAKAAHLFWNFGNFAGKLHFAQAWGGTILAPKATVHADAGLQSGRVVAKTVGHKSGEIHMAVSGNRTSVKTTSEPKVTRSNGTSKLVTSTTPTITYKYKKLNVLVTPDVPDVSPETPVTPNTPDTPDVPETPGATDTQEVPDTPDTPNEQNTPAPDMPGDDTPTPEQETLSGKDRPSEELQNDKTEVQEAHQDAKMDLGAEETPEDEVPRTGAENQSLEQMVAGKRRHLMAQNTSRKQIQTGDESNLFLYGSLSAAALCALAILLAKKKAR